MTWKAYAAVSGAGLLATYLASTPPAVAPAGGSSPQNASRTAVAPAVIDIQADSLRRNGRAESGQGYAPPSRDPFRFAARRARGARTTTTMTPPPDPQLPPDPLLQIKLSGIFSTAADAGRTAVFITAQGPLEAREGDLVALGYRLTRVTEDSVELTGPNGVVRWLQLRP